MRCFALFALLTMGCSSSKVTEVVVEVTSSLRAPDQVDSVEFVVNEPGRIHEPERKAVSSPTDFPLTLGVIFDGGECNDCSVTVNARRQAAPVFSTTVPLVFTAGQITRLRIQIGGAATDAGATDTRPAADTRTSESCASNCSCVSACTGSATVVCEVCQLTCPANASCSATAQSSHDVSFQCGARASCVFDVTKARNAAVTCSLGSKCEVTCGSSNKCDVTCTGAACLVTCQGGNSCGFSTCTGATQACSNTSAACGRACP